MRVPRAWALADGAAGAEEGRFGEGAREGEERSVVLVIVVLVREEGGARVWGKGGGVCVRVA